MRNLRSIPILLLMFGSVACSDSDTGSTGNGIGADVDATTGASDAVEVEQPTACASADDCGALELEQCQIAACQNNVCVATAAADFSECKDGFKCTGPDFCLNGQCGGSPLNCDDEDPCTEDSCTAADGCVHEPSSGAACNDGDPCTTGDICEAGACVAGSLTEGCCVSDDQCADDDLCTDNNCLNNACETSFNFAPCDDGSPCTLQDHCDGAGGCTGTGLVCDDGNPCTDDTCDPGNGTCVSTKTADGAACEDGNPCTTPDSCIDGQCIGQSSVCECNADADCAQYEDDDLCNGTLKCLDFKCIVDPITLVACNPTGDTPCVKNTCSPSTGLCAPTASEEGTLCDDGNICTDNDSCLNGLCQGGASSCDDGNPCTFDACSPALGCTSTNNTLPCNDGDACTQDDTCAGGSCFGTAVTCDDDNPCTDDSCDSSSGCTATNNSASCSDGNNCTDNDLCVGGACVSGENTCACVVDADCAPSEDGDLCNGTLQCIDNLCVVNPLTIVACNTTGDTACVKSLCDPAVGQCSPTPSADGTGCSDGSVCTLNDVCTDGTCAGQAVDCDDSNLCTVDTCDPLAGCQNTASTATCDDGNSCTGNDNCSTGSCVGVPIGCDDGNPCTVDTCDPATGCQAESAADGTACSDGDVCTSGDICTDGVCGGTPLDCSDGNVCTDDVCNSPDGCANPPVANGTPCDDGSACSDNDNCQNGVCTGNPPSCDDGNPCTVDICDPQQGCQYSNASDGTACSDGDPCTAPDNCQSGACQPGNFICGCLNDADCADEEDGDLCNGTLFCDVDGNCKVDAATIVTCADTGDPCIANICQSTTGNCSATPSGDGASCDDGDACTLNDICTSGLCSGFPQTCNDDNPCTADTCENGVCKYSNAFNGQPCADDGNSCTLDVCQAGKCSHPNVPNGTSCAGDGNSCTSGSCKNGTCTQTDVEDGFPCTDDGNPCTYDQCSSGICQHISNDPAPVGTNECFPVQQLTADTGVTSGTWDDCGVADQFDFDGGNTGAIDNWPCADPSFVYEGSDTGYEYAYVFVAPSDGTCTLIEYDEGLKQGPGPGGAFPVIDWFILTGGGCDASSCVGYMWQNTNDDICGNATCSYLEFATEEGQVFYIVADIFDGVDSNEGFLFENGWDIEIVCDSSQQLLINEDFDDAVCNGCSTSTQAQQCPDFDWHAIGGFADVVAGYYLGQLDGNTLTGYDCGGTTAATLTFPTVTLPADATDCTLTFDYYAELDPNDDTDCTNDVFTVLLSENNGPAQPVPGDACDANSASSNPIGYDTNGATQTMTYDLSYAIGSTVTLEFDWTSDDANNGGLGIIIDNVKLSCNGP